LVDLNQENETDKLNRFKCDMISNLSRISELTSQLNLNIEKINKKYHLFIILFTKLYGFFPRKIHPN
jgi:hypothetical protein